jgi:hypothetical protein
MASRLRIHGAGVAGLSVAAAVRRLQPDAEIRFVDPHATKGVNKSLAFFDTDRSEFAALARCKFMRASIYAPTGEHVVLDCSQSPYCLTDAADVIAHLRREANFQGVCSTYGVEDSSTIVDARPSKAVPNMWQVFFGGVFELENDCDSSEVVLMDFRVPQNDCVRFIYIVPFTSTRLLIQDTYFCTLPMQTNPDPNAIARHLLQNYGLRIRTQVGIENGAIPMGLPRTKSDLDAKAICVGAKAGWIRASTGYSLIDTQRGARAFAVWLAHASDARVRGAGAQPVLRARPWISDCMDSIFLSALAKTPEKGAEWLAVMFAKAPASSIIRFLTGCASTLDHLKIALALARSSFSLHMLGLLKSKKHRA